MASNLNISSGIWLAKMFNAVVSQNNLTSKTIEVMRKLKREEDSVDNQRNCEREKDKRDSRDTGHIQGQSMAVV